MRFIHCLLPLLFLFSCAPPDQSAEMAAEEAPLPLLLPERPNILWLVAEDLSPFLPAFGDSTIRTPALSRLAAGGICYDNTYAPAPVCSPARFGIATGMYPNHLGAQHMRTGPWYVSDVTPEAVRNAAQYLPPGIEPYEAVPPPGVKMMSEYLREAGYYCTNNVKEDYQFRKPPTAWDKSSNTAHWRNRAPGQPFFAVFNFEVTHESRIWRKADDSLWVDADLAVDVPPYLPDTEVGRRDIRRMYSNIKEMDQQVGKVLAQLEDDGLLDSTIVFFYGDHGGPLPRHKRMVYDSGIRVPMIIRYPGAQRAGTRDDQLISFIDFAPTVLSVVGIEPPDYMDGYAFLGAYDAPGQRVYIHAAADRMDESYDTHRAVRDKRYKYIRYYQPEKPMYLPSAYRDQMPIMQELHRLHAAGELTDAQARWFRETKPEEELFDTRLDPYELKNLAANPDYAGKLRELRAECERWMAAINDKGLLPEAELRESLWPGGEQPVTADPEVTLEANELRIACATPGASIGYKILLPGEEEPAAWQVYTEPVALPANAIVIAVAHRIGYAPSEVQRLVGEES